MTGFFGCFRLSRRWAASWAERSLDFRPKEHGAFGLKSATPRTVAALAFLAEHRLPVPAQVSLMTVQGDSTLAWCEPSIAHTRWDDARIIRRLVRWVGAVEKGGADREMVAFPAEFVAGASTGPVWKG